MTENRTKYMRDYQNFRGELIIKAEMIYGVICKENLKEFKVRIDCVLEGISEEEIQERILKMFATDKIKVSFK